MERVAELEEREQQSAEATEELVRKRLKLEWIDSEWFQVWLKLARREHDRH